MRLEIYEIDGTYLLHNPLQDLKKRKACILRIFSGLRFYQVGEVNTQTRKARYLRVSHRPR